MVLDNLIRWVHLLAAATWTGGLITLGALVPALRSAGADRSLLQVAARRFGRVSWVAMAVAVFTGLWQVDRLDYAWGALGWKLTLVGLAVTLALVHQLTARRTPAAVRGIIQGVILLVSLGIFWAAVSL
jgi:putative copper export protein